MAGETDNMDGGPERPGKGRPRPGAAALAAVALAAGRTAKDAAEAAGVHERTIRKWLAKPTFRGRVERLRAEAVAQAVGRLGEAMTAAADALRELAGHRDPNVRFRAAKAVLELGVRFREHVELEQRLRELEARFGGPAP